MFSKGFFLGFVFVAKGCTHCGKEGNADNLFRQCFLQAYLIWRLQMVSIQTSLQHRRLVKTLYHTVNFGIFQTERVCRRQF